MMRAFQLCFVAFALALVMPLKALAGEESRRRVDVVTIDSDVVGGVLQRYIHLGIEAAVHDRAQCLVIEMDTPGGELNTTHRIMKEIINSDVPIVVYVSPSGARAGSAGVFITYAAHIAAMAPMTRIGAAHVVLSGGAPDEPADGKRKTNRELLMEKVTNDIVAAIVSIAKNRGRNAKWAEDAVRKSVSIPAEEALKLKVIDLMANDLGDLLQKIDGRQVRLSTRTVTLHTRNALVHRLPMNAIQSWLGRLLSPELMMILVLLTIYGLIGELSNPGTVLPGVVGVISLILLLASTSVMQMNAAGLALIGVGVAMMLAEVKFPTHGALLIGGLVAFVLGALMLFDTPGSTEKLSLTFVLPSAGVTALFFLFIVGKGLQAQRLRAATGKEGMIGLFGVAKTSLNPEGQVQVRGEWWSARSMNGPIDAGARIEVVGVEGFSLLVKARRL